MLNWTTPHMQPGARAQTDHPNTNQTHGNASTLVQLLLWSGNRSFLSAYCRVMGTVAATTWSSRGGIITSSGKFRSRSRLQPHRLLLKRALQAAPLRALLAAVRNHRECATGLLLIGAVVVDKRRCLASLTRVIDSRRVKSWHVTSCHVRSGRAVSRHRFLSCHCHVGSSSHVSHVFSCRAMSCHAMFVFSRR